MRKFLDRLLMIIVPGLSLAILYLLGLYTRRKIKAGHPAPPGEKRRGIIYALWHENLLMHAYYYRSLGINILVSASRDGEYAVRAVEKIGFKCIRGSSSRGGQDALRKMARALGDGETVAMTPDGPRGPRRDAQLGIISLAKLSGAPIVPIAFGASWSKRLNSWDKHIIPLPGSELTFVGGNEIIVGKEADKKLMERKREELEKELRRVIEEAEAVYTG